MFRRWFGGEGERQYERGMRHFNRGELEEALACFQRAADELGDRTHPYASLSRFYLAQTRSRLGARLLQGGDDREALEQIERALAEHPGYPDLHFRRGLALLRLGDPHAAEEATRAALTLNPDFVEARVLLTLVHRARSEDERARRELERARELSRHSENLLARRLVEGPEEPTTEALWAHLFDEQEKRRRIDRAQSLFHQGFWEESRVLLEELVAENPGYPDLRLKLATVHFELGALEEAQSHLESALAVNPHFTHARTLAGAVLLRRGRVAEACEHYERRPPDAAPSPFAAYGQAVASHLLGDVEGALDALGPIVRGDDPPRAALWLAAFLHAARGEREAQAAVLLRLERVEEDPPARLDGVALCLGVGDVEGARRWLRGLPPGAPELGIAAARTEILLAQGEDAAALDVLEALGEEQRGEPALLELRARVLRRRGELDGAVLALESLAEADPGFAGVHATRASLLRRAGRAEDALGAWARARHQPSLGVDQELEWIQLRRQVGEDPREDLRRLARRHPLHAGVRAQDPARWLAPLQPAHGRGGATGEAG